MYQLQGLSPDQFQVPVDPLAGIWPNAEWSSKEHLLLPPLEFSASNFPSCSSFGLGSGAGTIICWICMFSALLILSWLVSDIFCNSNRTEVSNFKNVNCLKIVGPRIDMTLINVIDLIDQVGEYQVGGFPFSRTFLNYRTTFQPSLVKHQLD